MKKTSMFLILIILSTMTGLVAAGPEHKRDSGREALILDKLNLTAEQLDRIRRLKETYLKDKEPFRNQLFNKRMELKLLWMQTKPDPDKIKSMQKDIHNLKWQLYEKRTDYYLSFRSILTPEQLSAYIALRYDKNPGVRKGR